ncbi:MAG: cell division protein [Fibrobacteraceae bacterium]|nr:cell division protein [Fibrobacteraceae bacterium]
MFGQLGYLLSESFRGWKQHHTVILPSLVTIFLCSLLLATSLVTLGCVVRLLSAEKSLYTVEAFLRESVSEDSVAVIKNRLEHFKRLTSVEYVCADSALADFRRHFSAEMLDVVEGNPIPPFFRMSLAEDFQNPGDLAEAVKDLSRENLFEEVQAPVEWAEKVAAWKFKMVFWPICLSILLLITLSLIMSNSVRLSLLSRKLLVENMKYAGGSTFFIQFPFVMQGVAQGVLGSGLSAIILAVVVNSLADSVPLIAAGVVGLGYILVAVVLLVTLLSAYFSYRTVRGFLCAF